MCSECSELQSGRQTGARLLVICGSPFFSEEDSCGRRGRAGRSPLAEPDAHPRILGLDDLVVW
jgi:hypothetical protein